MVSALYSNPTYWQSVLSEANQFVLMQLFQEVQRGQFESGARKLSADQTLERLRSAEQSIEMLQVKCEKKETHIFELEHRIKERNRQIEQLEKVVRRRSSVTSRYNASSSSSSAPPPSRRQYLNENQRRHMNSKPYLCSVEVEQGVSASTSFSSSSSEYRPTTSRAATSAVLSNRTNTMSYRPPSPPPASSRHHQYQMQPEHKTITTKKTPRTSSSFRKTPGLDALLREQEMLFSSGSQ